MKIFNKKELIVVFDMEEQERIKQILEQNSIPYTVKVCNRRSSSSVALGSRGRTGSLGEKLDLEYEYQIFVKKEDFERAQNLL